MVNPKLFSKLEASNIFADGYLPMSLRSWMGLGDRVCLKLSLISLGGLEWLHCKMSESGFTKFEDDRIVDN